MDFKFSTGSSCKNTMGCRLLAVCNLSNFRVYAEHFISNLLKRIECVLKKLVIKFIIRPTYLATTSIKCHSVCMRLYYRIEYILANFLNKIVMLKIFFHTKWWSYKISIFFSIIHYLWHPNITIVVHVQ